MPKEIVMYLQIGVVYYAIFIVKLISGDYDTINELHALKRQHGSDLINVLLAGIFFFLIPILPIVAFKDFVMFFLTKK